MTKFVAGNKVKVVQERTASTPSGRLLLDSVHMVASINSVGDVELFGDDHQGFAYHSYRFVLFNDANGIDRHGVPQKMTADDLKPFQRAKMRNGETAIVCVDASGVKGLVYPGNHQSSIHFDGSGDYVVVEVYDAPRTAQAVNFHQFGLLVWKAVDHAKVEAKRKADEAVATARAALEAAEAARAAL